MSDRPPVTPMMQQYLDMKEHYKDCILFFRLGDFYEMFNEDAVKASKELEIALTGRDCGLGERAPMCGVPYHAADTYISKLIEKGYKVAICEQTEDPAMAKGIVKREVIKIVTPGTVTDNSVLDEKKNNYIACISRTGSYYGFAAADVLTGEFLATSVTYGSAEERLLNEIAKYMPSEIVIPYGMADTGLTGMIKSRIGSYISYMDDNAFESEKASNTLKEFFGPQVESFEPDLALYAISAAGALITYISAAQKTTLGHFSAVKGYKIEDYMVLDQTARRNLELTETLRDRGRKGSLLGVADRSVTSMGGRLIRKWIEEPLLDIEAINSRLDSVAELKEKYMLRMEIREILRKIYDMERLSGRISLGSAQCRDLISLRISAGQLPFLKELLRGCSSGMLFDIYNSFDALEDIYELINSAINDDPPLSLKDGGIIKEGYSEEADRLRAAGTDGKNWIAAMETAEKDRTGIRNLKVGFNKVFGYYIEVTRSHLDLVPENYIRKQTLANCERYITDELKKIEDTVLHAEEKLAALEYELFLEVRQKIADAAVRIKNSAFMVAVTDAVASLAELADREDYRRPDVNDGSLIKIIEGRHPVVEKNIGYGSFVPNDTLLDNDENRFLIITGPNMAGKSTYMRQTALIVIMAQMGSFVPAAEAVIGVADRIFTRVGASDDLSSGQSTFMVEMSEVASIINNATPKSLLILDEIGRGTSTFDGLSIAWAVTEFISSRDKIGCRTLFATHYHELTELEGKLSGVKNYCITVEEKDDGIVFLRKIIRGGADESYGIQVAKLAGIPSPVTERAHEILKILEDADVSKRFSRIRRGAKNVDGQVDIFAFMNTVNSGSEVLEELKNIDIRNITPVDALNILYSLQKKAKKGI